jgi:DNA-binding response OmpR family regulator
MRFDNVIIDRESHRVTKRGTEVSVTPRAIDLLPVLSENPGKVWIRHDLLKTVWNHQAEVVTRTVDSHISELRQKLETDPDNPRHIITVWKKGYRCDP